MRSLVVIALACLSACSWEGVVVEAQNQAAYWRVTDSYRTDTALRWRLPAGARLQVLAAENGLNQRQAPWLEAAQIGVDRVFGRFASAPSEITQQPTFYLTVMWPRVEESTLNPKRDRATVVSLLGIHTWPQLPRTGQLRVHLQTDTGQPMYQANFDLSAKLWGRDWQDRELLEQAFFELAVNLRGS